jgi:hypothetical protein
MITNQQLAELLQSKLNGEYSAEFGEYANLHKYELDTFTPNVRYEFKIFANDGEYAEAENRDALVTSDVTNTVTQYINGVFKTPGGNTAEGASAETLNTAVEAQIELLIPNCDDEKEVTTQDGQTYRVRLQDVISMLVQDVLSLPSSDTREDKDGISYFIGGRYSHASVGEKRHRTQVGLSVVLSLFMTFAIVAMGISSREIKLEIEGEPVYFNRISISRSSTQENNVSANPDNNEGTFYGVSKARTTATQLVIGFSAPVRPSALNGALVTYVMDGEVPSLDVSLTMPTKFININGEKVLGENVANYKMTFAEGGIAGEENLNAAYDIRLVEVMEG